MKIPGENLNGVYSANEFLTRINLMKAYNFPDCDTPVNRSAKTRRLSAAATSRWTRPEAPSAWARKRLHRLSPFGEAEMPARLEEVHHAKEEGIIFKMLTNPTRILGDENGWVNGMNAWRWNWANPTPPGADVLSSRRARAYDRRGHRHHAIGTSPNPLIKNTTPGLATEKWGGIVVDEATGETSRDGVYAGGDAVTGAATVILAMGAGKTAAAAIHEAWSGPSPGTGSFFDAGIRAIEDSGIMLPMLKSLGIEIPFVKSPVSLGIADRMVPVETAQNLAAYGDMLKGLYPDNQADVDAILDDIRLVMRHMEVLYGIENPIFKDLLHDQEYVMKVLMPWMGRFPVHHRQNQPHAGTGGGPPSQIHHQPVPSSTSSPSTFSGKPPPSSP
jgi:hypothetical protein